MLYDVQNMCCMFYEIFSSKGSNVANNYILFLSNPETKVDDFFTFSELGITCVFLQEKHSSAKGSKNHSQKFAEIHCKQQDDIKAFGKRGKY